MSTSTLRHPALRGSRLLAVLAVAVAVAVAGGVGLARAMPLLAPTWAADPDRLAVAIVGAVYLSVAAVLLVGLGRHRAQRRSWLAVTPVQAPALGYGATVWAGAYVAALALYTATSPLGLAAGDVVNVLWAIGADNGRLSGASPALAAFVLVRICGLAPVAEELLFRGALFAWLRQRLAASWTIGLTAVGFALIHQAPAMLPLALLVGVAAGIVRERTGSVTVPIVIHALQNLIVVALSFAVTGWQATLTL